MKKHRMLILLSLILLCFTQPAHGAATTKAKTVEGYIMALKTTLTTETAPAISSLQLQKYDGTFVTVIISNEATFTIDQLPVKMDDFKPGMEVYGELKDNKLSLLQGFSTSNPGYIVPQSKMIQGRVVKIDQQQINIIKSDGREFSCSLNPATVILKNSLHTPVSSIYEGDQVKLYFDEIDAAVLSRVQVEGPSIVVKDIYRGKLNQVDEARQSITLMDVQVWQNAKWEDYKGSLTLPYNRQSPAYLSGQMIPFKNLKQYRGKTVYMAMNSKLGRDRIEKMVINRQYEVVNNNKISNISWYSQALELRNKRNYSFNDGTIIIKNGRLMDSFALGPDMDTLLIADNHGTANVIKILDIGVNNNSTGQHNIYLGRLRQVADHELVLTNVDILNNNCLQPYNSSLTLQLNEDTVFFDRVNNKVLNLADFKCGNYAQNSANDWYGYLYTDGDMLIAGQIQQFPDSIYDHRVSKGIVVTTPTSGPPWLTGLRNIQDWSNSRQEWMLMSNNRNLQINETVIIKDDRVITPEDLKPGDRLYILQNSVGNSKLNPYYAKVIIVK